MLPVAFRVVTVLGFTMVACVSERRPEEEEGDRATRDRVVLEYLGRPSDSTQAPAPTTRRLFAVSAIPSGLTWRNIGPRPTTFNTNYGLIRWSGRVNALAIDPSNSNIIFAGSDGGGVWRSLDAGATWSALSDFLPSLEISSVAVSPSDPATVYAGTGLKNFSQVGILKSPDGGNSWTVLPVQFGIDKRATSIAVHPTDPNHVLAGMMFYGVYRSPNGGGNFTRTLPGAGRVEVIYHPTDGMIAYAAIGGPNGTPQTRGVFKSIDGGSSWNQLTGGLPDAPHRIVLAMSRSNPQTLYALFVRNDQSVVGLYRTDDAGLNWDTRSTPPDYCTGLCGSMQSLAVHPLNPDIVFLGGLGLWRSLTGGTDWRNVTTNESGPTMYVHVDQHALAFTSDGTTLYAAGDGGIWSTPLDPGATTYSWESRNADLSVTQFYGRISISPASPSLGMAGSQDNNTQVYRSGAWEAVTCGDGGSTAIAATNPPTLFTVCFVTSGTGISLRRSRTYGSSWSTITIGSGERASALPPITPDPNNLARVYTGTYRVYRSDDTGRTWTPISGDLAGGTTVITAIAVAPRDSDVVYIGTGSGRLHVTSNATSASRTWTERTTGLTSGAIRSIVVSREAPTRAYVAHSGIDVGHVFATTNGGQTLPDITGVLSDKPVLDLALFEPIRFVVLGRTVSFPDNDALLAATPLGVLHSPGSSSWTDLASGLPRAQVTGLATHARSGVVRAGTYGRGMWEVNVSAADLEVRYGSVSPVGQQRFSYSVMARNLGPAPAVAVNLLLLPPQGYRFRVVQPVRGACASKQLPGRFPGPYVLWCDNPRLMPGDYFGAQLVVEEVLPITPLPPRASRQPGVAFLASDVYDPDEKSNRTEVRIP